MARPVERGDARLSAALQVTAQTRRFSAAWMKALCRIRSISFNTAESMSMFF